MELNINLEDVGLVALACYSRARDLDTMAGAVAQDHGSEWRRQATALRAVAKSLIPGAADPYAR